MPGRHLGAHPLPGSGLVEVALAGQPLGRHGDAPGRQLVERGEIEVAEDHHGGGARDRRRRHHQQVGVAVGPLGAQRGPLLDAETVLLVDDDAAERAEADLLGQQGVRPHHEAHGTRGQPVHHGGARLTLDPAREQFHPDLATGHAARALEVAEQRTYGGEVLLGEDLGGHHEGTLVPALDRSQERGECDHGLTRADVALEQAVHGERPGHVGDDHGQGAALRRRELVGQAGEEPRDQGVGHRAGDLARRHVVVHCAGVVLEGPPPQDQRQLQAEELVEDEATPGRLDHIERFGQVDGVEGLRAVPQVELGAPLRREGVDELAGALERLPHPRADLPGRQPRLGRGRVHRQDAQCAPAGRHAGHDVDDRVGHLPGAPVLGHLAEEDRLGAGLELLGPPGLVEEDDLEPAGVVADDDVDDGAPGAGPARMRRLHRGQHGRLVPDHQVGDVGLAGAVDVAPRVGRQQVEDGLDAQLGQHPHPPLRDAVEPLHADGVQRAECAAVTQSPTGTGREAGRPGAPRARRRGATRRATPRSGACRPHAPRRPR